MLADIALRSAALRRETRQVRGTGSVPGTRGLEDGGALRQASIGRDAEQLDTTSGCASDDNAQHSGCLLALAEKVVGGTDGPPGNLSVTFVFFCVDAFRRHLHATKARLSARHQTVRAARTAHAHTHPTHPQPPPHTHTRHALRHPPRPHCPPSHTQRPAASQHPLTRRRRRI